MAKTSFTVDVSGREHLEEWRPIPRLDIYEMSNFGRLRRGGRILAQHLTPNGYLVFITSINGKCKTYSSHKYVLITFRGAAPEGMECRHLNGIRTDNRIDNLVWGTHSENAVDQVNHGTHRNTRKTHCKRGHEFTPENTYSRDGYKRTCLPCKRIMENRAYHRRQAAKKSKQLTQSS